MSVSSTATERKDGQPSSRSSTTKDLISLRNSRNGEVYKFSCVTCINGHRAPLCDPKKHRGKVMYRRPLPGRPARQCGHPKTSHCDCLAKRTLCCVLTDNQWNQVEKGYVVSAKMFDSMEDLEAAEKSGEPVTIEFPENEPLDSKINRPIQPKHPSFQMYGDGSNMPTIDAFAWPGFLSSTTVPPTPYGNSSISSPSSASNSSNRSSIAEQGQYTSNPFMMPSSISPGTERKLSNNQYFFSKTIHPSHIQHETHPQTQSQVQRPGYFAPTSGVEQTQSKQGFAHQRRLDSVMQDMHFQPINLSHPYSFADRARQAAQAHPQTSLPMRSQSHTPAQVLTRTQPPVLEPTQSCSSKRSQSTSAPSQVHVSQQYPGLAPSSQFPCSSCASTLCQCSNCPSTMQSFATGGAWARACGRTGHLEDVTMPTLVSNESHSLGLGDPLSMPDDSMAYQIFSKANEPSTNWDQPLDTANEAAIDWSEALNTGDETSTLWNQALDGHDASTVNPAMLVREGQWNSFS